MDTHRRSRCQRDLKRMKGGEMSLGWKGGGEELDMVIRGKGSV